jgi:hypothetical protein
MFSQPLTHVQFVQVHSPALTCTSRVVATWEFDTRYTAGQALDLIACQRSLTEKNVRYAGAPQVTRTHTILRQTGAKGDE